MKELKTLLRDFENAIIHGAKPVAEEQPYRLLDACFMTGSCWSLIVSF